ncbi:MAG: hypothetical protein ACQETQ_06015 [Spirochaetota bacterium]
MKRLAVILVMFVFAAPLFSQSITIENDEDALFLFEVIDTDSVPAVSRMENILDSQPQRDSLRYVPPQGVLAEVPAEEGQSIVGVFVEPGRSKHPLVFISELRDDYITVSRDDLHRDEDRTVQSLAAGPIDTVLNRKPVIIDNDYHDWRDFDAIASFSSGFAPEAVELTRGSRSRERGVSDSFYWGKAGTRVAKLKGLTTGDGAYLMLETREIIAPGVSYYLYAYDGREREGASATVEIAVTGGANGFVFLWLPGRESPHVVGEFVHDGFYLEARVEFSRLPETVRTALADRAAEQISFDFSSAYSGARMGEEFFYTTLYARDIVDHSPGGL